MTFISGEASTQGNWFEEEEDDSDLDSENLPDIRDLGFESEIEQMVSSVRITIQCLFRLTIAIRNPAPHDILSAGKEITASRYEPYDIQHVLSKFPKADIDVTIRLGVAISRRREYFNYRHSHHEKLAAGLDFDENRTEMQSAIASSIPSAFKDSNATEPAIISMDKDGSSDAGVSETSVATTVSGSGGLKIAPIPYESAEGAFECPYCYMLIRVTGTLQWK